MSIRLLIVAAAMCFAGQATAQSQQFFGLNIGARSTPSLEEYVGFQCTPSELFKEGYWCSKASVENTRQGRVNSRYTMVRDGRGIVSYLNREWSPAFTNEREAYAEIDRLSKQSRSQARILTSPASSPVRGFIVLWGGVQIEELSPAGVALLRDGKSPQAGILIDYIGNLRQSARDGLPVYRLIGPGGQFWNVSFDQSGKGHLRFGSIAPNQMPLWDHLVRSVEPVDANKTSPNPDPEAPTVQASSTTVSPSITDGSNRTIDAPSADIQTRSSVRLPTLVQPGNSVPAIIVEQPRSQANIAVANVETPSAPAASTPTTASPQPAPVSRPIAASPQATASNGNTKPLFENGMPSEVVQRKLADAERLNYILIGALFVLGSLAIGFLIRRGVLAREGVGEQLVKHPLTTQAVARVAKAEKSTTTKVVEEFQKEGPSYGEPAPHIGNVTPPLNASGIDTSIVSNPNVSDRKTASAIEDAELDVDWSTVPWYRKYWGAMLLIFLLTPIGIANLWSGEIISKDDGRMPVSTKVLLTIFAGFMSAMGIVFWSA